MPAILVTGAAGFIGFHVARQLLDGGLEVVGIDNLNDYYDPQLKKDRLSQLEGQPGFEFHRLDLMQHGELEELFAQHGFSRVVHLAAQAGVRHSLENPRAYIDSNVVGFLNLLECCRQHRVEHLVYASSSSVYGANTAMPFAVKDPVDHPLSLYGATKKSNELMAHAYSHLFRLPTSGLRFFTVYGPWGRPDMALYLFTRAILEGRPIELFNEGKMQRGFTYVDDAVDGLLQVLETIPEPDPEWSGEDPDPSTSTAPYRVYNMGTSEPVELSLFVELLEKSLGRTADKKLVAMQPGDVPATSADLSALAAAVDYQPGTSLADGIQSFVRWYGEYHQVEGIPAG
ncbi:MAG: NAD-dependent epimerase [Pirellulaceae bacterium]